VLLPVVIVPQTFFGAIVLSVAMVAVAMVIVVIVVATVTGAMPILGNKCTKVMRISETHFAQSIVASTRFASSVKSC